MRVELLVLVASCCLLQAVAAHKWYSSVPVLPALVASSDHITDPLCYNHSRMFLQALDNYTLWAVQMLDASVKMPDGVIDGSRSQLGHFDQCLSVSVDDLHGQYCLVEISFQPISYTPTQTVDPYSLEFDPRMHVWEKLKRSKDSTKITRSILHLGLCLPASCTPDQVQVTLEHELGLLGEKEGLVFKARVSPRLCTTQQESAPWTAGEIAYSCSVSLVILVVVISSFYAYKRRNKNDISASIHQALLCLSVQRSVRGLLKVYKQHPGLDCVDVYKVVCIVCVILGHRMFLFSGAVPVSDANQSEQLFRSLAKSLFVNGALIVDIYFVVGGALLAFNLLHHLQKHKSARVLIVVVIVRFLRLMPIYMMILFFYTTLFYRMGSGPLWESVVGQERDRCQSNWWTNLLYINNYFHADSICMLQTWYLSVDTQLFMICLLVVYVISRRPFWGYALLAAMSALSVLVPFLRTWWRREDAFLIPFPDAMADVVKLKYFHEMYIRAENRAAPYFIGVVVGLILDKFRNSKFRMSLIPSLVCFAALKVVMFGSMMASYPFYRPGSSHTHLQAALYASLSRVSFGCSIGGVILLATFGSLGFLAEIARWKPFRVLGRLVYGVYIVHMLGDMYNAASLRTSLQTGMFPCLWMVMGDVMFSFCLSFLLTVLLESPVRALEKLVFQRDSPPHSSKHQKTPGSD